MDTICSAVSCNWPAWTTRCGFTGHSGPTSGCFMCKRARLPRDRAVSIGERFSAAMARLWHRLRRKVWCVYGLVRHNLSEARGAVETEREKGEPQRTQRTHEGHKEKIWRALRADAPHAG